MFGSDFIVIKDKRGFKTGFHWSDVHTVLENYDEDGLKWVKVKFGCDPDGAYSLKFIMTLDEFLEEVKKQLEPQDAMKRTPNPYNFPPPPADEFFKDCATTGDVTPMSTMDSGGVPVEQIVTE